MRWNPRLNAIAITGIFVAMAGCSAKTQHTAYSGKEYPPRPESHEIQVYRVGTPRCPYEEIASVEARDRYLTDTQEMRNEGLARLTEMLMDRARQVGGDAIAGLDHDRSEHNHVLRAVVLRFTDPDCTE